jgi:hypothetical protein
VSSKPGFDFKAQHLTFVIRDDRQGGDAMSAPKTRQEKPSHKEELLDEALEESFPASDPASLVEPGGGITGPNERRDRTPKRNQPAGQPKKR